MINFIKKIYNKNAKSTRDWTECSSSANSAAIFYALDSETERRLGRFEIAIKLITKAIEIEPHNDMYYVTRALAYREMKNYNLSLIDIEKALEINPNVKQTQEFKQQIIDLINENNNF